MHSSGQVPGDEHPPRPDCLICDMENADDAVVVFRDDLWSCEVLPGYEVPGWLVLRVRRHALGLPGLSPAELDGFGLRVRDVVAALSEATGAAATYVMSFGETYPHFHALVAARGDEVPPERRLGRILELRMEQADPAASRELVPLLRAAYAKASSAPS